MPAKPPGRSLILAVDDDPAVGRAIERDLRHRYGARHRVLLGGSGEEGLDLVEQIVRRGEPVALLVADQRMPGMSGVEFLARALRVAPEAKRVLLTAYADTEAAIRAINELRLDHYLMKPWSPPEERLYPVLDDLLEDWEADCAARLSEPGLRLVGHRLSAEAHATRDFLARNRRALPLAGRGRPRGRAPHGGVRPRREPPARARLRGRAGAGAAVPGETSPGGSACTRRPTSPSTTWSSSAAGPPVWPRPSTARPRACGRS